MELWHYLTRQEVDPFQRWLDSIADVRSRQAVLRRVDRLARDNFGDCRFCRDGVWELRIDFGPGYRVYFARLSLKIVLLLAGGSKRTQARDIDRALDYWNDYRRRRP